MYVSLGGEAKFVKNAILSGKRKLDGLGVLPIAATATAAMPVIIKALDVIKKLGLSKKGDENAKEGGDDAEDDNKFNMIANAILPPKIDNENTEENNEEEPQSSNPLTALKQQVNKNINQIKDKYVKPLVTPKQQPKPQPQRNQAPVQQQEQEETSELPEYQEPPTQQSSGGISTTTMLVGAAIIGGIALAMSNNKEEQTEPETIETEAIDVSNQYNQPQNQAQYNQSQYQPTQNFGKLPRKKKKAIKKLSICKLQ